MSPAAAQQTASAKADFPSWLDGVRAEARAKGIAPQTLDAALANVSPIPKVIELDRKQPEFTLSFAQYRARVVSDARIAKGRERLSAHSGLLEEVGARFGVQPRFIVALWGIETDFGRLTGGFPVVASLATLAYDGRRASYFRGELMNALSILDQNHISPERMIGSWAGAMGQNQFMPSSFLHYAVDYNGDGKRDIWGTTADVFASTANYLAKVGWNDGLTWGREVRLPKGFSQALIGLKMQKPLEEWHRLGVTRADGGPLPAAVVSGSLVRPGREAGPVFLVYDNYRAILRWNRSDYFATAVGLLADRISAR